MAADVDPGVREKSAAAIVSAIETWCVSPPDVPTMPTEYIFAGVAAVVVIVSVEIPEPFGTGNCGHRSSESIDRGELERAEADWFGTLDVDLIFAAGFVDAMEPRTVT